MRPLCCGIRSPSRAHTYPQQAEMQSKSSKFCAAPHSTRACMRDGFGFHVHLSAAALFLITVMQPDTDPCDRKVFRFTLITEERL